MGKRLGLIAGGGRLPHLLLDEADKQGYACHVAAIRDEADVSLMQRCTSIGWFVLGQVADIIGFFKKHEVRRALFAGKIRHQKIYDKQGLQDTETKLPFQLKDRSPTSLIEAVIGIFSSHGIEIIDPTPFISTAFCKAGPLTSVEPTRQIKDDIAFGWTIARKLADLDIGQTVIVKDRAVVAVEGMEGTDQAIRRAGRLAGKGTVGIKVSRSRQDPRIDLPAVGLGTVRSLVQAGSRAFCIEAEKVPLFQKEEALRLAEEHGLILVALKRRPQTS